jgi:nitroreductase
MDLFETIGNRYSYRGDFTAAPVPRKDLERIVQAGIQAPSACNEQVAAFVVVDDPSLLRQIAEIVGKPVCRSAKAMIAVVADPRPVYANCSFAAEDCAAAVENMLLAVTALGYASVWLDGVLRVEGRAARIGQLLGVPPEKTIRILLPLGVPAGPGQQREKLPFHQRAWFNRYDGKDAERRAST